MIVQNTFDCIDEAQSKFEKFKENDKIQPDKAGEYIAFYSMKINKMKINNEDIFRIKKFEIAIIVSERIANKIKKLSGVVLTEV